MASREKKRKKDGTEIDVTMTGKNKKPMTVRTQSEESDIEISATVELDVFDCPICFEPLQPPLFQCQNGHVACFSCYEKLKDNCPSCGQSINHSRCLAFEKVIESFKVPCSYATDGCKEIISYARLLEHKNMCLCPMHLSHARLYLFWINQSA